MHEVAQRRTVAGTVSIAVHAALVLAAVLIFRDRTASEAPVELVEIGVVAAPAPPVPTAPPPPAAEAGTTRRSTRNTATGTLGRRGRDAPPRSLAPAPSEPDPRADMVVSYETPTGPDPGNQAGTTGLGIGAGTVGDGTRDGTGTGRYGLANLPVPPAPTSHARPARPKADYGRWNFRADRRFAGATVLFELTIDPTGHVQQVRVLRGVDESVDRSAAWTAKRFEFHPALNDAGEPTWDVYRWEFVLDGTVATPGFGNRRW